ncbi:MAG: sensor histidine kinase [Lachnospiraceae bacterium]|nr:sensor histidine kinase [Lachnospiraceae bacterium]
MMWKAYLKDYMGVVGFHLLGMGVVCLFLRAYHAAVSEMATILVIYMIALIGAVLWDYTRKREFYDKLQRNLEELDQKYLLCEMIKEPRFYEGKVLYEALRESDKSMMEQVAAGRKKSQEFREYIELWVHEIKIPLAGIRLMCHNNSITKDKMIYQLRMMDEHVENVLFYARSENAGKDYLIQEVELKKIFGNVALKNKESLQLLDATIETRGLDKTVMTDGKWLEFILNQLMSNSMKYRAENEGLHLEIVGEETKEGVKLSFTDNGLGIPEGDLQRVFEKTFTGENGRKGRTSTGMGLYIVKSLCDRLGHGIGIFSKQGEYTRVEILFGKNDFFMREER